MKKYLESIIVIRRIGLLTFTVLPLVMLAMGIADVKAATGYSGTLPGDATNFAAASPFTVLTSSYDTMSGDSFVRANEGTGYLDTLPGAINFGAGSPFTLLLPSDDTISEDSFVGRDVPTNYPDTLPGGAINFGAASPFTVLTSSNDTISGSNITGNVGIQSGTISLAKNGNITGNLVYHTGVTRNISGHVSGTTSLDNAAIDNAFSDLQMLSDAAFAEPVTPRYATLTTVNLSHNSLTITGGANEKVVLRLTDFILTSSNFTLSGTATTAFLINVTRNFSLSNSSINLQNVLASHVLFNIRGTGNAVTLTNSSMTGNLLALNRTVNISNSNVTGKVIANQVTITSSNVVSPTTNP